MKNILLIISLFAVFFMPPSMAQNNSPVFADLSWGLDKDQTRQRLNGIGFTTTIDKDGDVKFAGELLGHKGGGFAFFSDNRLVKIQVLILTPDDKAFDVYRQMKDSLSVKYGVPTSQYESFQSPYYKGDGYAEQAIRVGKGNFATFWGERLSVEITKNLSVNVTYESELWSDELKRRRARATKLF